MEETLRALGEILLKAVPTFVLVFLLYLYLSRMFFRPLEAVLQKRYAATEGARKLADESLAKAAAKTSNTHKAARKAAKAAGKSAKPKAAAKSAKKKSAKKSAGKKKGK